MFEDAVNVREELEDALSEFMLMGDKAKLTLEEELARMESSMNEPEEGLDEVSALREQLSLLARSLMSSKSRRSRQRSVSSRCSMMLSNCVWRPIRPDVRESHWSESLAPLVVPRLIAPRCLQ
jgi:hypothetical protein